MHHLTSMHKRGEGGAGGEEERVWINLITHIVILGVFKRQKREEMKVACLHMYSECLHVCVQNSKNDIMNIYM